MMKSTLKIVRLIIMVITGVSGTFLNAIIVVLNFRFWRDITTSGSYNKILLFIGLINLIFQGILILDCIFETFALYLPCRNLFLVVFTLELAHIGVNVWNTTWLSIFCCVRLVNSSNSFFLKIRAKFFSFLPHLIVFSVLVSAAINLLFFWTTKIQPQNATDHPNMSGHGIMMGTYYIIFSSLFGFGLPFFMTGVSIGLSVITLLRHIWTMRSSDSHLTSAQLQGHYRAVRTMVIRVILDILFFCVTAIGMAFPSLLNSPVYSVLWIIVMTYPTSQAFILIFGNPKLKSAAYDLMKTFR